MEIIRRRNYSPETCRLVEQRNQLSRPGTLRRRYDQYTQRTVFAPSRPNKRSREEIAEIDAELMRRANRLGGGYQPITEEQDEPEELREEGELEIENAETEEDSIIMRGDNLPIVDLSKYNTDGKEAKYIQINHIVGKLTGNKKITEENIKKAEFEFMMDLKTLIAKTAIDPELTRVRNSMRREDRETIPDGYRTVFDKLSIRWGLVFVDDQIVVPIDLRRKLLDIIHFGHSGITKMNAEAKIFWWPGMKQDIENKVKDYTACLASASNKPKIPIYVGRDADGDITNHIVMARTKTEEKHLADGPKSPKKKNSTERKIRKEPALHTTGEINPKNRHCIRGLDGKYTRWDETLKDILNGKLKIVPNKKRADSDTEEDDDDEDEEMPEEIGTPIVYDTSEKDGRYVPIRTNPEEEDTLQLHTDSEIAGFVWTRHKGIPKPETVQKPADFLPEESTTPGPSNRN